MKRILFYNVPKPLSNKTYVFNIFTMSQYLLFDDISTLLKIFIGVF